MDQDTIDSDFFHLDRDAEVFRRLKSRNVLRFVLGIHQEKVAELEVAIERIRRERVQKSEAGRVLLGTLREVGFQSVMEIDAGLRKLQALEEEKQKEREEIRGSLESLRGHAVDKLRWRGQSLAEEIEASELAVTELRDVSNRDREHLNEILSLSMKTRRVTGARSVLNALEFQRCPRCTQGLPDRNSGECPLCGQPEPSFQEAEDTISATEADLKLRVKELRENLAAQEKQAERIEAHVKNLAEAKAEVDRRLREASVEYDSAYLSEALELEREIAELHQQINYLKRLSVIPGRAEELRDSAAELEVKEKQLREALRELREKAEQDTRNLKMLRDYFLDCLVRSEISGFDQTDDIDDIYIRAPDFFPEARSEEAGELITTSFSTLGSGGKKTLFKACYALAFHRLARKLDSILPTIIIIDSPMKNISERENREQFEGFYRLVYELSLSELRDTQIVIIDKEYTPPSDLTAIDLVARHMKVDDVKHPPLISYYRGK